LRNTQIVDEVSNRRRGGELSEQWIQLMKGMTDLIYRTPLVLLESAVGKESILLKEETNLIA
jgi:hypothetical protein